jgi:threonine-phosphate decarboxylase
MSDHGGNVHAASVRTGIPQDRILDFSASINPLGVPKKAALLMKCAVDRLHHYPEPYSEQLCGRLASTLGVNRESIVCGNGSTELIYLIPRALRPGTVLIPAPAFGEYEKACLNSGAGEIARFPLSLGDNFDLRPDRFIEAMTHPLPRDPMVRCSMAFLCNPNNPTGRLVAGRDVVTIAGQAQRLGCFLVVDEAFIDFCSGDSVVNEVEHNPYLIVLRSMTKFFALPGLRIGYAVMHPDVTGKVMGYKEPWTVNSIAQAAGNAVLDDRDYQEASLSAIRLEKAFMEDAFNSMGMFFISSRANYYLVRMERAREMRVALEQKGILIRDCSNFDGLDSTYLRIAVRSRSENALLTKEMAAICARLS